MKKVPIASDDYFAKLPNLSTMSNVLLRNGTYPLIIPGSVYNANNKKMFLLLLFTPLEFFTSVLADGLSLESEWQ